MLTPSLRRVGPRLRTAGLVLALALVVVKFLRVVNEHYPVRHWLFWRYATYWLLCAGLTLACLSAGHAALLRTLRRPLPLREHAVMSLATGFLLFFFGMALGGFAHAYGPAFFW